ncbi:GntR family transcriptional regulator [Paenibacillus tengchongensis]|uniref:GntR family transcriptional regulator n=1 Tax=Paenibacillus tengchongensis TaxID=2608684 RepID=UPI001C9E92A0|nr:GntR family transcriptional regulator [Paenibacillus tengchongensis]
MIDLNSKLPYYSQLKEYILNQINSGVLEKGNKIPSELDLAEQYGISRPTVRQAIGELVQEGYLVKKRGLGTFVSSPIITGNANVFTTFAEEMMASGLKHGAKLISNRIVQASDKLASELKIKYGSHVFEIVRLRLANDEPLAIRTSFIPCELYPDLLQEDLEGIPLYVLFEKRGLIANGSTQSFQAVSALPEEAELLQVEDGSPMMLCSGVAYNEKKIPIEKYKALHLGNRFRFTIEQSIKTPAALLQEGIMSFEQIHF